MSTEVFLFLPMPGAANHYREAYPYGPGTDSFHTDLGIEIDPGALTNSPALAIIPGLCRWVSDSSSLTTGTLILRAAPSLVNTLAGVFQSTMVFVYRNIEFASMISFFGPRIDDIKGDAFKEDERETDFINGQYPVWVEAGDKLGLPGPGDNGWSRLGFEIAFVPPLARGSEGVVRLMELINPNATTRRLDPLAFYARVATAGPDLSLTPSHANHPLLTLTSRRILFELRDEYDAPSDLELDVLDSANLVTTTFNFDPVQRSTVVLDTAPASGAVTTRSYSIAKTNYLFTKLPSGVGAFQSQAATLTAPDHWAIQTIFMPPENSVDPEPDSWFVPNTSVETTPALARYTSGNKIAPIRDGFQLFFACAEALKIAKGNDDYILMANWWFDDGLDHFGNSNGFTLIPNDPNSTLAHLTGMAAIGGVQVRALLFAQPPDTGTLIKQNLAQTFRINNLPGGNGQAVFDDKTASLGSHHQKFMIVKGKDASGNDKVIGFCGGVDFNSNRRDLPGHRAFGGYHDVHAQVEGPALLDMFQSFKDRWDIHLSPSSTLSSLPMVLTPSMVPPQGSAFVQVARTYPKTEGYAFAPQGSFTPLQAFLRAIKRAKKFIYIEDQYLTPYPGGDPFTSIGDPLGIVTALREALNRIDYLVIVIPNHTEMAWLKRLIAYLVTALSTVPDPVQLAELIFLSQAAAQIAGQARFRRKMFIRALKDDPQTKDKVHVFYLGRNTHHSEAESILLGEATEGDSELSSGGPHHRDEIYCHSKVWIVDDIILKIGSANCNKRSYTHDSEMDLVIVDGAVSKGARTLAQNFRMRLWAEHLGMRTSSIGLLQDHLHALKYWMGSQRPGSHIRPYDEEQNAPENFLFNVGWNLILDPDGSS